MTAAPPSPSPEAALAAFQAISAAGPTDASPGYIMDLEYQVTLALDHFAAEAVAREREACAGICDQYGAEMLGTEVIIDLAETLAQKIRARGDAARPAERDTAMTVIEAARAYRHACAVGDNYSTPAITTAWEGLCDALAAYDAARPAEPPG